MIARMIFFAFLIFAMFGNSFATAETASTNSSMRDGAHDFDFLFGEWSGKHHKLKHRLSHSNEWEDFTGTLNVQPLLGGRTHMDESVFHSGVEGAGGFAFRLYDPAKHVWSIYWFGTTSDTIDPPMVGRFVDGVGTFYGDDTQDGKPVRVRFIWSKIDMTHCHWEQALSDDGGKTWETNWSMDFERTAF